MGDLTRLQVLAEAQKMLDQGWTVFFKFTCQHCGARVVLQDANTLWSNGECCECGKITEIKEAGFLVQKEI